MRGGGKEGANKRERERERVGCFVIIIHRSLVIFIKINYFVFPHKNQSKIKETKERERNTLKERKREGIIAST